MIHINIEQEQLLRQREIIDFVERQIQIQTEPSVLSDSEKSALIQYFQRSNASMPLLIKKCIQDAWRYGFAPDLNNTYLSDLNERLLLKYIYYSSQEKQLLSEASYCTEKLKHTKNARLVFLDLIARLDLEQKWNTPKKAS